MNEKGSLYKMKEKHIPFDHQEYLAEKAKLREEQENDLFGQDVLGVYDYLRDDVKRFLKLADEATIGSGKKRRAILPDGKEISAAEHYLGSADKARAKIKQLNSRSIFEQLQKEFDVLLETLRERVEYSPRKNKKNRQRKRDVLNEVGNLLRPLVGADVKISLEQIEGVFKSIKEGKYSNIELLKVLKAHREYIATKERILNEKVEVYKKEFQARVKEMVKNGELPESALVHLGNIEIAKPNLIDDLAVLANGEQGEAKKHDGFLIRSSLLEKSHENELKRIAYHEFVHILEGKGVNLYSLNDANEELLRALFGSSKFSKRIKRGLLFQSYKYDSNKFRNRSLNEATTELLALLILGDNNWDDNEDGKFQGSEIYVDERRRLDALINKGLSRQTLFEAYFENVTSDQSARERFRYTGRLIREMDAIDKGVYLRWNNEDTMAFIVDSLVHNNIFTIGNITHTKDLGSKVVFSILFSIGKTQYSEVRQAFVYVPNGEKIDSEELKMIERIFDEIKEHFGGRVVTVKDIDLRKKDN